MLPHIAIRRIFPISFQTLKAVTAQSAKQYCRNTHYSINVHPSVIPQSYYVIHRGFSDQVTPEEVIVDYDHVKKAVSDTNILIVDVREPDEVKEYGKIPNSINIPLGSVSSVLRTMSERDFEQTYKRAKPTEDTPIIFYCMIGKRSGMAQQNAFNLGYKNVKNYLGSWTDWANKTQ